MHMRINANEEEQDRSNRERNTYIQHNPVILILLKHLYALSNIWRGPAFLHLGVTISVVLHFD